MHPPEPKPDPPAPENPDRRRFLSYASSAAMAGGLIGGYGTLAVYAGRFLYPSEKRSSQWLFVSDVGGFANGDSVAFRTPDGAPVTIARQGDSGSVDDFVALSSVCPHLGCKVHWELNNQRFFCPCHNGVFDAAGRGIEGPPKGMALQRFPLQIVNGLLFIEAPVRS